MELLTIFFAGNKLRLDAGQPVAFQMWFVILAKNKAYADDIILYVCV